MLKCKLCGTAITPNSSVCVNCGASLSEIPKNSTETNGNEIFSNRNSDSNANMSLSDRSKEIYSSRSNYDKEQQRKLFEKIRKQEEALGEVADPIDEPSKPDKVEPVVINRKTHSDVVNSNAYVGSQSANSHGKSKPSYSKNHTIPQRVIESSDSQIARHKMKPTMPVDEAGDDEKVELVPSNVIDDIRKKRVDSAQQQKKRAEQKKPNEPSREKRKQDKLTEKQGEKRLKEFEKKRQLDEKQLESEERLEVRQNKKKQGRQQNVESIKTPKNRQNQEKTEIGTEQEIAKKPIPKKRPIQEKTEIGTEQEIAKKSMPKKRPTQEKTEGGTEQEIPKKPMPKKRPIQEKSEIDPEQKPVENSLPKKRSVPSRTELTDEQAKTKKKSSKKKSKSEKPKKEKTRINYDFSDEDIEENKNLAAFAYLGIFFLLPFAKRNESDFCKAHAKQGIAVFIMSLIVYAISLAIVIGLRVLLVWTLKLPYVVYNIATLAVAAAMLLLIYIPVFEGAISAFSGTYKSIPFVGRFVNKEDE